MYNSVTKNNLNIQTYKTWFLNEYISKYKYFCSKVLKNNFMNLIKVIKSLSCSLSFFLFIYREVD